MRKVTIKDVANDSGLSIATVSYVMNGKRNLPPETIKKVQDTIEKLGYVKNYSASSLSSNTSHLIGIVIPQSEPGSAMVFENPFYSEILSSIEYHARIKGYHVMVSGTNADEKYFNLASQRNLDGVIVIGAYPEDFYEGLDNTVIPMVLVDSYLEDHNYGEVKLDDEEGGYLATKYLLSHGHREIAFLSSTLKKGGVSEKRFEGYQRALREEGIEVKKEWMFSSNVDFDEAGKKAILIKQKTNCTAVFCTADIMAIGLIKQFTKMGIDVPKEMSIVGFDNLHIANYCTPGLTTVGQNIYEKGKMAVEILYDEMNQPKDLCVQHTLPLAIVERESVCTLLNQ